MQQIAEMNVCVISPMAELGGENILGKGVVAPRGHYSMHRGQTRRSQFYWQYGQ